MHFASNLLTVRQAVAWAGISPMYVRGDLYDDNEKKIAEGIDMLFTSEKTCEYKDSAFDIKGDIDTFTDKNPFFFNNTSEGIAFLQPHT